MKYLLDTDHFSILQRSTGQAYTHLSSRMERIAIAEFGIAIVTVHEQFLGSHTYINRARNPDELIRGYEFMIRLVKDFKVIPVVPFDASALDIFESLHSQKVRVGTMDLRIASIAISHKLTLLTRNQQDFIKVPELSTEDWTQP